MDKRRIFLFVAYLLFLNFQAGNAQDEECTLCKSPATLFVDDTKKAGDEIAGCSTTQIHSQDDILITDSVQNYVEKSEKNGRILLTLKEGFSTLEEIVVCPMLSNAISVTCADGKNYAVNMYVIDTNNNPPEFDENDYKINLPMPFPPNFGITGSTEDSFAVIKATDIDLDGTNNNITFSTDNDQFEITCYDCETYQCGSGKKSIHFAILKANKFVDVDTTLTIIATDGEHRATATVTIQRSNNVTDEYNPPAFSKPLYEADISEDAQTGEINFDDEVTLSSGDLNSITLSLRNSDGSISEDFEATKGDGKVVVSLKTPVEDLPNECTMLLILEAASGDKENVQFSTVLSLSLPLPVPTTVSPTTPDTCPPCTTTVETCTPCPDTTTSEATTTTCPTVEPCPTTVTETTTCDCSDTTITSGTTPTTTCPPTDCDTTPTTCPSPSTCDCATDCPSFSTGSSTGTTDSSCDCSSDSTTSSTTTDGNDDGGTTSCNCDCSTICPTSSTTDGSNSDTTSSPCTPCPTTSDTTTSDSNHGSDSTTPCDCSSSEGTTSSSTSGSGGTSPFTCEPCTCEPCTSSSTAEPGSTSPSTCEPCTSSSTAEPGGTSPSTCEPCTCEPCTSSSTSSPFTCEPCTTCEPCATVTPPIPEVHFMRPSYIIYVVKSDHTENLGTVQAIRTGDGYIKYSLQQQGLINLKILRGKVTPRKLHYAKSSNSINPAGTVLHIQLPCVKIQFDQDIYHSTFLANETVHLRVHATSIFPGNITYELQNTGNIFIIDSETGMISSSATLDISINTVKVIAKLFDSNDLVIDEASASVIIEVVDKFIFPFNQVVKSLDESDVDQVVTDVDLVSGEEVYFNFTCGEGDYFYLDGNDSSWKIMFRATDRDDFVQDHVFISKFGVYDKSSETVPCDTEEIITLSNEIILMVTLKDINDNSPEFIEDMQTQFGFPSPDLLDLVLPQYVAKVKATDKDVGENGLVTYSISTKDVPVVINRNTGIIYPASGSVLNNDLTFTVMAQDGGNNDNIVNITIKMLSREHIFVVTVDDVKDGDLDTAIIELNNKLGTTLRDLSSSLIPYDESKRMRADAASQSFRLVAYAFDAENKDFITIDSFKEMANGITKVETLNEASVQGSGDETDTTGLTAASITLGVIVLLLLIGGGAGFYFLYIKPRREAGSTSDIRKQPLENETNYSSNAYQTHNEPENDVEVYVGSSNYKFDFYNNQQPQSNGTLVSDVSVDMHSNEAYNNNIEDSEEEESEEEEEEQSEEEEEEEIIEEDTKRERKKSVVTFSEMAEVIPVETDEKKSGVTFSEMAEVIPVETDETEML